MKPGIKKGSLSEDEQRLVISLQAKHGNRWKKIAAQVPGTTAKRLSKWWEVYREKQDKVKDRKGESSQILLTQLRKVNMIIFSRHLQRNTCKSKSNWLLLAAVIYQLLLQCLLGFLLPLVSVCQQIQLQISFISPSHLHLHLPLALLELLYHVFLHGCPTGQIQIQLMGLELKPFFILLPYQSPAPHPPLLLL